VPADADRLLLSAHVRVDYTTDARSLNNARSMERNCSVLSPRSGGEELARQVINPYTSHSADGGPGLATGKQNRAGILGLIFRHRPTSETSSQQTVELVHSFAR